MWILFFIFRYATDDMAIKRSSYNNKSQRFSRHRNRDRLRQERHTVERERVERSPRRCITKLLFIRYKFFFHENCNYVHENYFNKIDLIIRNRWIDAHKHVLKVKDQLEHNRCQDMKIIIIINQNLYLYPKWMFGIILWHCQHHEDDIDPESMVKLLTFTNFNFKHTLFEYTHSLFQKNELNRSIRVL